jgi:riboflavin kinase, archaea type
VAQAALKQCLGYNPFPATLNVRPKAAQDAQVWQGVRNASAGVPLAPAANGFCSARLYPITLLGQFADDKIAGAILLPEVENYPPDKIEIVAPVRLKEKLGVRDGDQVTWEFLN